MFRKVEDFTTQFETEYQGTLKVLRALTDASLAQPVSPGGRTLGRLAWHIAQSQPEMGERLGLAFPGPAPEGAPVPASAAEIARRYEQTATALLEQVRAGWTDEKLLETSDMYGEQWANGLSLEILIRHEAHHRGQMTVLMRQAGLTVPGVYGPAREEWALYGMPAQV